MITRNWGTQPSTIRRQNRLKSVHQNTSYLLWKLLSVWTTMTSKTAISQKRFKTTPWNKSWRKRQRLLWHLISRTTSTSCLRTSRLLTRQGDRLVQELMSRLLTSCGACLESTRWSLHHNRPLATTTFNSQTSLSASIVSIILSMVCPIERTLWRTLNMMANLPR